MDYTTFVDGAMKSSANQSTTMVRAGTGEVDGTPALLYRDPSDNTTGYVATTAPHYLLRITAPGGTDLVFSGWNQPVTITAPPKSQVYTG